MPHLYAFTRDLTASKLIGFARRRIPGGRTEDVEIDNIGVFQGLVTTADGVEHNRQEEDDLVTV